MVKEVRYAWDDEENNIGLPDRNDRFDDSDDALLDPFLPDSRRGGGPAAEPDEEKNKTEQRKHPHRQSESRHLADADWINNNPSVDQQTSESE